MICGHIQLPTVLMVSHIRLPTIWMDWGASVPRGWRGEFPNVLHVSVVELVLFLFLINMNGCEQNQFQLLDLLVTSYYFFQIQDHCEFVNFPEMYHIAGVQDLVVPTSFSFSFSLIWSSDD